MTVPPLIPTSVNNRVFGAADWKLIRSLLAQFRDSAPTFKGDLEGGGFQGITVPTNTLVLYGGSVIPDDGFATTPDINVGGWTVATEGAEPLGVVVPQTGVYLVSGWAYWETEDDVSPVSRRVVTVLRNRAGIKAAENEIPPSPGVRETRHEASTLVRLNEGDELHVGVLQSAGFTLNAFPVTLSAQWITAG